MWVATSNCGPGHAQVPCPNLGHTSDHARLAGEMATTQYALDDLQSEVAANRDQADALLQLAERLEDLAKVLRVRAGNRVINTVLEQP